MLIIKRNGGGAEFDKTKIESAINKAFLEVDGTLYETDTAADIASEIEEKIKNGKDLVSVEQIQDWIEEYLMRSERKDVARAYVRYRYKREVARNAESDFISAIREKLNASDVQNQNANVDEKSFGGRIGEASGVVTKKLALDYIVSPMAKANHLNNEVYIHDLDSYYVGSHNCLSIPFDDLLANGFNTRQTDVRPAQSVSTAFQLVAVIFQLQSLQQFGGVSATHIDWTMVPYVRKSFYKHFMIGMEYIQGIIVEYENGKKIYHGTIGMYDPNLYNDTLSILDKRYRYYPNAFKYAMDMTKKEIYQAVEGLYHNLNTLQSRSGNQLPFTSLNYGTCTAPEGQLITEALLDVLKKGLGKLHKTSIFPCGIFQCMKGVNRKPEDPNYYLYRKALECTAQRLYPNYANVDWSGNEGYDPNDPTTYFSTMGKRKLQLM